MTWSGPLRPKSFFSQNSDIYRVSRIGAYSRKYWSKPQLHSLLLDQVAKFWPVVFCFCFFLYFLTPILTYISTLEMLTLASMDHIMLHIINWSDAHKEWQFVHLNSSPKAKVKLWKIHHYRIFSMETKLEHSHLICSTK